MTWLNAAEIQPRSPESFTSIADLPNQRMAIFIRESDIAY